MNKKEEETYETFEEVKEAFDRGELDDAYFFIDNDVLRVERMHDAPDSDVFEKEFEVLFKMDGGGCQRRLLRQVLEYMGFDVRFA